MNTEYGDEARAEIACEKATAADFMAQQLDSALEAIVDMKIADWLTSEVRCPNCVHWAVCEWHNKWDRHTEDLGAANDYLYNLIHHGVAAGCRYFKPAAEATEAKRGYKQTNKPLDLDDNDRFADAKEVRTNEQ